MKRAFYIFLDTLKESLIFIFFTLSIAASCFLAVMPKSKTINLVLVIVLLLLYWLMCYVLAKAAGEKNYKAKVSYEARVEYVLKTGKIPDGGINDYNVFRAWKGFAIMLILHIPLIVLMILSVALSNPAGIGCERAAIIAYGFYGCIVRLIYADASAWLMMIGMVLSLTVGGMGYLMGGLKQARIQSAIARRHREIYGDDAQ